MEKETTHKAWKLNYPKKDGTRFPAPSPCSTI